MKRNMVNIFIIVMIGLILLSTGCASKTIKATDLMEGVNAQNESAANALVDSVYVSCLNDFASELFISSCENGGNVMISPVSVYLALAMTVNGADGNTKTEILDALASRGITLQMINAASRDLLALLDLSGEKTTLSIADSIWYDQTFVPDGQFLQNNANYYNAQLQKLDFKDSKAPNTINEWVSQATQGKIGKIISSIDSDVVMYLINTIYFKSDWMEPFSSNDTKEAVFYAPDGTLQTDFLNKTGSMDYISGQNAQGVLLSYENEDLAYFALLPNEDMPVREWIEGQGTSLFENLFRMIENKEAATVQLSMPKFETSYEDSLINELTQLGIIDAFDTVEADLSLMNEAHIKNLYISDVLHKTYIKVDEKGTEAAAATSVEVGLTSMPSAEKELNFNKPFIYGVIDLKTNTSLFVGIMENPLSE